MSAVEKPLLSIAIPTYNRSVLLDRNLQFLFLQLHDNNLPIEIIVSDNCSTDDTGSVVEKYIDKGLDIKYVKNPVNKGMDFNIAQCYFLANGKYVVALGDDDFFLKGSLKLLIDLLQDSDYGVVYFKGAGYGGENDDKVKTDKLTYKEYTTAYDFIKKVHYYITFISGNIVNTKYLDKENVLKYFGTNLPQLPFFFKAVFSAPKNVVIDTALLGVELDNTGGYNLFKVFGEYFNRIIDEAKPADSILISKVKRVINKNLLISFFPVYILKFRTTYKNNFVYTDSIAELEKIYKHNIYFYLCCYPVAYLPTGLARQYRYGLKLISKLI